MTSIRFRWSAALLEAVNEINCRYRVVRAVWDGQAIILQVEVPGQPYVGGHVLQALNVLGIVADEIDDDLQRRFGGRTFFGEQVEPSVPSGNGGYL